MFRGWLVARSHAPEALLPAAACNRARGIASPHTQSDPDECCGPPDLQCPGEAWSHYPGCRRIAWVARRLRFYARGLAGGKRITEEAMGIAGKICIYTNENLMYEELA